MPIPTWCRSLAVFCITLILPLHFCLAQQSLSDETTSRFTFKFNVDTAYVQFGMNHPKIYKIANGDTVHVNNGFYHLYLSYPTTDDTYITQNALRDSLYTIEHDFDLSGDEIQLKSKNASIRYLIGGDLVVLSDSDTEITLDGQSTTQFGVFSLSNEVQKLHFKNPKFYTKEYLVYKGDEVKYQQHFFYPDESFLTTIELIPGISQLKRKEYLKMSLIFGGFIASSALAIKFQREHGEEISHFNSIRETYLSAETPSQALKSGDQMEEASRELRPYRIRRNLSYLAIIGVLGYDVFDKVRARKKLGGRQQKDFEFFLSPVFDTYISAGAKIKF